jgi:hypothetical protein
LEGLRLSLSLLSIFWFSFCAAQSNPLFPFKIDILDYNFENEIIYLEKKENCEEKLSKTQNQEDFENLDSVSQNEILACENILEREYYDKKPIACSWYCMDLLDTFSIEKTIKNYPISNAFDFDHSTAFLLRPKKASFTILFKKDSLLFNQIGITAGDVKNQSSFEQYSKPKTIKLFLNDTELCTLFLDSISSTQYFQIPITQNTLNQAIKSDDSSLIELKVEVLSSYKGKKKKIAITEIVFDGRIRKH